MKRKLAVRILLPLVAAAMLVALAAVVVQRARERVADPPEPRQPTSRSVIRGLTRAASLGNGVSYALRVEELAFGRRRIGPLTINPLGEIEMVGLRLELEYPPGRTPDLGPRPVIDDLTAQRKLGFVSRIVVRGVELVHRSGDVRLALRADGLEIGPDGVAEFSGNVILSSTQQRLEASSARWLPRERSLSVHGPWTLQLGAERLEGVGGSFAIDGEARLVPR